MPEIKSKIVLVNPPVVESEPEWLEQLGSKLPFLGICSLAAYTRQHGFETVLVDAYNLGMDTSTAVERVLEFKPTHVGITAMTFTIALAGEFARQLKRKAPHVITIIGGNHVTALPETTLQEYPDFDIGVLGEGEETLVEILKLPSEKVYLGQVKGIIFWDAAKHLKRTGGRPQIKELDSLPFPAWDMLPGFPWFYKPTPTNFKKLPVASLVTSRGCPYHCTFCDRSVFGNTCRWFSSRYILRMIKELKARYAVREVCFYDDTFTAHRKRLVELCEGLLAEQVKISWSCLGRVDFVDEELLALMKRAGCWLISYGIESASQEILDLYEKKTTAEQVKRAVEATKRAGIKARGFFIIGGPLETEATVDELKELLDMVPLDDIHLSFFTPIPGSRLYEDAERYGTFDRDWKCTHVYSLNYIPYGLTPAQLESYRAELYRRFYFRPSRLFRYLLLMLHPRRMKEIMKRGIVFLKLIGQKKKKRENQDK